MSDISINGMFDLSGKTALVTGGSRGLGLHAATALLLAGAKTIFISARKAGGEQGIDQAVKRLNDLAAKQGLKGRAIGIPANVAQEEDIKRLVEEVKKHEQTLDILLANAGATWGGPFEPTPDWSSQKILDLNVRGVFNLARLFAPMLAAAGKAEDPSRIIVMSSVAGTNVAQVGDNGTIMYSASKAAAHHLARNLAVELGPRNITVNTIAPGFFPSKLANGLIENLGGVEQLSKDNPRKRLGEPADIAGVTLFLCSKASSYVNGEYISVDGGQRLSSGRLTKI
ncbi:related to NADPH-dependent beta-ketoacyl reductase (rhlG) [Ramularia collo-cygni]|uniref:Related to NADPH-dependent beta-ketoacyl reductase (RhlG) n=1 Tax=Ramularia collo-cygni TaxID=112498 RepID=A0A2D3V7W6_9PEZI|nr:related to NADPH-dependent beta-ketoacyl reductase (rhlG) [Ramularia collo-cygni]CZT16443.1 related to NADPH-dependent beta-ketoacyl reductase (rhlG) [Ramularia collo-cygni]